MASRTLTALGVAMLVMAGNTPAQSIYKIVGADGKVTFSDKPPATGESAAKRLSPVTAGDTAAGAELPFELRQVSSKYPVTVYTASQCAPCDAGRTLLRSRGIPFSEKTITSSQDSDALQALSGESTLPFVTIGAQKLSGFVDSEWGQYLDAAGYPKNSVLPKSYRHPAPTPLVAVQKAAPPKPAPEAKPTELAPPPSPSDPSPTNPAGIRF